MAQNERKTKDLWLGTKAAPVKCEGGVTTRDVKGKYFLKLVISKEQYDTVNAQFADDIALAHSLVEQERIKMVPGYQTNTPDQQMMYQGVAACSYRDWAKPMTDDANQLTGEYSVSVSQSSVESQMKRGFASLIKVRYYNVNASNKAKLFGTYEDPLAIPIPGGSLISVKVNTMVSPAPNNATFGLSMGRLSQVFVYEFGESTASVETMPDGIELDEDEGSAEDLPDHVKKMLAASDRKKAEEAAKNQPQQQAQPQQQQNPYGVQEQQYNQPPQQQAPNPYQPQNAPQGQPSQQAPNPYQQQGQPPVQPPQQQVPNQYAPNDGQPVQNQQQMTPNPYQQ